MNTSFWNNRTVAVTGGAGFIGSHLTEALCAAGANVRVLARYNSEATIGHLDDAQREYGDRLDVRLGTISDPGWVRNCLTDVDTVFHLAALIGIPYSYVAPHHYVETNVLGTLAVLEAVRALGIRRMVHTSTSECFGSAQYVPMDEKHPIVAQSPYSATKVGADALVESYCRSFDTPAVILRPFNTFGPRQSRRAVIPTIISQLVAGPDVKLGALSPIRDLNPVANTVQGFMRAASTEGVEGETFVVGYGSGRSVQEVAESIAVEMGSELNLITDESRIRPEGSEVDRLICDFSKAKTRLGYTPMVTFEEGIRQSIAYWRSRPVTDQRYIV
jgi:NAD dependent epimerase/dehydratase